MLARVIVSVTAMAMACVWGRSAHGQAPPDNTGAGACDLDFNNDGFVSRADADAFAAVYSEAECDAAGCDNIDFNGDGASYDPADMDAFVRAFNGGACPNGWYPQPKFASAAWIYWSEQRGDDANDAHRDRPVASQARVYQLVQAARLAGRPAAVVLFRGERYTQPLLGEYGSWAWGGTPEQPLYIMADPEQDPALPRPLLEVVAGGGAFLAYQGNIRLIGLHVRNPTAIPNRRGDGLAFYGKGEQGVENIVIDDCLVELFGGNVKVQTDDGALQPIRNVVISRTAIVGAWSTVGYAQGLFLSGLEDVRVVETALFANGYNLEHGALPTMGNHNYYGVASNQGLLLADCVTVEASATGIQMRGRGQRAERCVAINNPLGITGGHVQAPPGYEWTGGIVDCLILGGGSIHGDARSLSLAVNRAEGAQVTGNTIWRVPPEGLGMQTGSAFWLQGPEGQTWTIAGNLVHDPRLPDPSELALQPGVAVRDDRAAGTAPPVSDIIEQNAFLPAPSPAWASVPSLVTYLDARGVNVFAPELAGRTFGTLAAANRRGAWNPNWTAQALRTYWRNQMQPAE